METRNIMPVLMGRRTFVLGTALTGAGLAAALGPSSGSVPPGRISFGAYDPGGDFSDTADCTIEHIFLPWEDVAIETLFDADRYARARNRSLLVTLEPWTWSRSARNTARSLREGIASGAHDANMRSICEVFAALESPLILRWGHEMDNDNGHFIWAGWRPSDYIAAYRRMATIARQVVPGIQLIWSPLGHAGMQDFYPGDDLVDMVGLSVFGLQAWDRANHGRDRSFAEILAPRYDRAIVFGKPVMVAELGYSGDAAYVAAWDRQVRTMSARFPALAGVVYFNHPEVYDWPQGFGLPDWRVTRRITAPES
jgi:endoglucanase